jgi:hypothetical protein
MSGKRKEEKGKRKEESKERQEESKERQKKKKKRKKKKEKCQGERKRNLADNVLLPSASLIFCKSRSFFVRSEGGTSTGTLITESWSNV